MTTPKIALIAGASGQVGNYLLNQLLDDNTYSNIIALVRKPLEIEHPKLKQMQVDFNDAKSLQISCNDVFCCLGTTIANAKTKEKFKQVDYEYVMALATNTQLAGADKFLVVSAMGANAESSIFYSRVKGETERDLQKLNFNTLGIFRPSMLLGPRTERRVGESIGKFLVQLLAFIIPQKYKGVHSNTVAKAMLAFAKSQQTGLHIMPNDEILKSK